MGLACQYTNPTCTRTVTYLPQCTEYVHTVCVYLCQWCVTGVIPPSLLPMDPTPPPDTSHFTTQPIYSSGSPMQLHIRGGVILPVQVPGNTTAVSRSNNFGLIVALDNNGSASGDLYIDDGVSLQPSQ